MKSKIYLSIAVLSLAGMLGQYMYYESQAEAQTSLNTYERTYTDPAQIRTFEIQENAKGCTKLSTNFDDKSGRTGTLVFTCDSRDAPPVPQRTLTQNQFVQELANERGVRIVG